MCLFNLLSENMTHAPTPPHSPWELNWEDETRPNTILWNFFFIEPSLAYVLHILQICHYKKFECPFSVILMLLPCSNHLRGLMEIDTINSTLVDNLKSSLGRRKRHLH